ncbi:uncharacterized protein Dana_GF21128 [Drosophila ananassae]|uniref:Uncharacterized protein n=1 Tax=Drosophila ananassae TaxID=7217 RepID=B3MQT2_DROAN|nr:uncharacterized protein LOC6503817 [Drosophila ananassae]EDV34137.1 uncharacterized protein Dana_GF21128 [Drosophila ananassae]
MRFYLLFFLALSCCLLSLARAGVRLEPDSVGHQRNSTGPPPPRGAPPPRPSTTAASSTG